MRPLQARPAGSLRSHQLMGTLGGTLQGKLQGTLRDTTSAMGTLRGEGITGAARMAGLREGFEDPTEEGAVAMDSDHMSGVSSPAGTGTLRGSGGGRGRFHHLVRAGTGVVLNGPCAISLVAPRACWSWCCSHLLIKSL